jgi:hypothetical protein
MYWLEARARWAWVHYNEPRDLADIEFESLGHWGLFGIWGLVLVISRALRGLGGAVGRHVRQSAI